MSQGLGFFPLASEEFNAESRQVPPGGGRSSRLLVLSGAPLYRLNTVHLLPGSAGLVMLSLYDWRGLAATDPEALPNVGLMAAICNVLAYQLESMSFTQPHCVAIGVMLVAVLLLTARKKLHRLTRRLEVSEIATAGKLVILIGRVLRFLPREPVTTLSLLPCTAPSRSPGC